jgi:hypothetical protein
MRLGNRVTLACLLATAVAIPTFAGAVMAVPIITTVNSSFADTPVSFTFGDAKFTFSATGDPFMPTAIQTADGAAVRSFGGFFIFPLQPSTDFPDRGSGILTYGPGTMFSAFDDTTVIPYSNGDNYLGLRATLAGTDYYGYAFTTDTTLRSFGFDSTPNTAFTLNTSTAVPPAAVPEPVSWAMFIGGFGMIGATMRRRKASVSFA